MIEGASGADVVGSVLDSLGKYCIAGQTKDVIDAVFVAPRHHLRTAVMPVAADRDVGRGRMPADADSYAPGSPKCPRRMGDLFQPTAKVPLILERKRQNRPKSTLPTSIR
jgi:hypothetical protein